MTTQNIYDLADTWNDAGTTYTAIKMDVTDTASNAASLLMDLQVGGTSRFYVNKGSASGVTVGTGAGYLILAPFTGQVWLGSTGCIGTRDSNKLAFGSNGTLNWGNASNNFYSATIDLTLARDAANTLALRNSTNAQTFNVYGTYTNASNYERLQTFYFGNTAYLLSSAAGSGTVRSLIVGTSGGSAALRFQANGTNVWQFSGSGHFLAETDNTYDIGASGATRPRRLYLGGGSLTGTDADSSVEISPTWNTTGTPTAFFMNVTDTASNASSLLMDLQVGGASKFNVAKDGSITVGINNILQRDGGGAGSGLLLTLNGTSGALGLYSTQLSLPATSALAWGSGAANSTQDVWLYRDAAATLALRNSTNAQAFNVYNTYTNSSNYERGFFRYASNVLEIGHEAAGTGTGTREIAFLRAGTKRLSVTSTVNIGGSTSINWLDTASTGDIGQSNGQFSPANIYARLSIKPSDAVAVSGLPGSPVVGQICQVNDATSPTVGNTVTGGGAAAALVWYNGSNWTVVGV